MRWIESLSSARMTACVLALGLIGGVPAGHAQVTGRKSGRFHHRAWQYAAVPRGRPLKKRRPVVRVFFMFDCPYCFQYDASFWQWGKSLPRTGSWNSRQSSQGNQQTTSGFGHSMRSSARRPRTWNGSCSLPTLPPSSRSGTFSNRTPGEISCVTPASTGPRSMRHGRVWKTLRSWSALSSIALTTTG